MNCRLLGFEKAGQHCLERNGSALFPTLCDLKIKIKKKFQDLTHMEICLEMNALMFSCWKKQERKCYFKNTM